MSRKPGQYEVLKTFNGSQDGRFSETFTQGETVHLSESLAEVALHEGWVRPERKTAAFESAPEIPEKKTRRRRTIKKG